MKYLFEYEEKELTKLLISIRKEVEEEYYYNAEGEPPKDNMHEQAINLIEIVFQYTKLFQTELWGLNQMMQCFYLLSNGEGMFLTEQFLEGMVHYTVNCAINNPQIILLSIQYLSYYREFLMDKADPANEPGFSFLCKKITGHKAVAMSKSPSTTGKNQMFTSDIEINRFFPILQKKYFDQYMIGQEDLKKKLAMTVYHYLSGKKVKPILLVGDTGTGKNHSLWVLKQFFEQSNIKVPILVYDTSKLTPNGFSGDDVRNIFRELKKEQLSCGTSKGIVYLDEICKAVMPNYTSQGENVSGLVQGQLLSALSGTQIEGVDTSEILFILGGVFADLKLLRKSRIENGIMGFQTEQGEKKREVHSIRDDLIEIGMRRELLGRISCIVELETLDRQAIRQILLHKKVGAITQKIEDYKMDELEIYIDDDVTENICDLVMNQNLGARGAMNVVEEIFGNYNFDMLEQGYSWIRIHSKMFEGDAPIFGR